MSAANRVDHLRASAVCAVLLLSSLPASVLGQQADSLEARLRLDIGGPGVVEGDEVRIFYEVSTPAHVAIFRVGTDGRGSLLFPQYPNAATRVRAGREHRLILAESRRWEVEDAPGEGYFIMIASEEELDFSVFDFDILAGWILTTVSESQYDDPYEAIDDYVVAVLPAWEEEPFALDLVSYRVLTEEEAEAERVAAAEREAADAEIDTPVVPIPGSPSDRAMEEAAADADQDVDDPRARAVEPEGEVVEEYGQQESAEDVPAEPAPQVVIVLPPAPGPRYVPPPAYRPPPRYGPPPPRYAPCCRYRAPAPRYYVPRYGPRPPARVRPAPPVRGRAPYAPPRGRGRYKERPVRISR